MINYPQNSKLIYKLRDITKGYFPQLFEHAYTHTLNRSVKMFLVTVLKEISV